MFRWVLMTLILVASFCYNINLKEDSDNKNIALSILGSSLFYLITDLIIFILIPLITQMGHRNVRINDLSSFVEAQDQAVVANNLVNNNQIQIPD
jgi:bacteriorhodopsin